MLGFYRQVLNWMGEANFKYKNLGFHDNSWQIFWFFLVYFGMSCNCVGLAVFYVLDLVKMFFKRNVTKSESLPFFFLDFVSLMHGWFLHLIIQHRLIFIPCLDFMILLWRNFNPLSVNPTKWHSKNTQSR